MCWLARSAISHLPGPNFNPKLRELTLQFGKMRPIVRLNIADDAHTAHVWPGKDAIMRDLLNARARFSNDGRQMCQPAGAVANCGRKTSQAAVGGQTDFNDAA